MVDTIVMCAFSNAIRAHKDYFLQKTNVALIQWSSYLLDTQYCAIYLHKCHSSLIILVFYYMFSKRSYAKTPAIRRVFPSFLKQPSYISYNIPLIMIKYFASELVTSNQDYFTTPIGNLTVFIETMANISAIKSHLLQFGNSLLLVNVNLPGRNFQQKLWRLNSTNLFDRSTKQPLNFPLCLWFCSFSRHMKHIWFFLVITRVRMGPGKPGKSWNFILAFSGLESPGKRLLVLESAGNQLKSSKKYEMYGRE